MTGNSLIDLTLEEIAKEYRSEILAWMKANRPDKWGKMLTFERRINGMALGGNLNSLRGALNEYQSLILAIVKEFKAHKGETGNLLEQRAFGFQMERPKSPGTG